MLFGCLRDRIKYWSQGELKLEKPSSSPHRTPAPRQPPLNQSACPGWVWTSLGKERTSRCPQCGSTVMRAPVGALPPNLLPDLHVGAETIDFSQHAGLATIPTGQINPKQANLLKLLSIKVPDLQAWRPAPGQVGQGLTLLPAQDSGRKLRPEPP